MDELYDYSEIIIDGTDEANRGTLNEIHTRLPVPIDHVVAAKVLETQIPFTFQPGQNGDYVFSLSHTLYFEYPLANTANTYTGSVSEAYENLGQSIANKGYTWHTIVRIPQNDITNLMDKENGSLLASALQTYFQTNIKPHLIENTQKNIYWYEENVTLAKIPTSMTVSVGNELDGISTVSNASLTPHTAWAQYAQRSYVVYNNLDLNFTVTPAGSSTSPIWNVVLNITWTQDKTNLAVPAKTTVQLPNNKVPDVHGWGGMASGSFGNQLSTAADGYVLAGGTGTPCTGMQLSYPHVTDKDGIIGGEPWGILALVWTPYLVFSPLTTKLQQDVPGLTMIYQGKSLIQTSPIASLGSITKKYYHAKPPLQPNYPGPFYWNGGLIGTQVSGVHDHEVWYYSTTIHATGSGIHPNSVSADEWLNIRGLLGVGDDTNKVYSNLYIRHQTSFSLTFSTTSTTVPGNIALPYTGKFTTPYYLLLRSNIRSQKVHSTNVNNTNVLCFVPLVNGTYGSLMNYQNPSEYYIDIGEQQIQDIHLYFTLGNEGYKPVDFQGDSFIVRLGLLSIKDTHMAKPRAMAEGPHVRPGKRTRTMF